MEFVIVANGDFLVREMIEQAIANKIIVALDGAANTLLNLGIKPHIILGDFDSINTEKALPQVAISHLKTPYYNSQAIRIVPAPDQNNTDLTKGIRYCDQEGAQSIAIICATGRRLDHHEANLRSLYKEYRAKRPLIIHGEEQSVRLLRDEAFSFSGEIGDKFGAVAYPEAEISSEGLRYELKDFPLKFALSDSTCNELQSNKVNLTVRGNALIFMPPVFPAQREFLQKTRAERLKQALRDCVV